MGGVSVVISSHGEMRSLGNLSCYFSFTHFSGHLPLIPYSFSPMVRPLPLVLMTPHVGCLTSGQTRCVCGVLCVCVYDDIWGLYS